MDIKTNVITTICSFLFFSSLSLFPQDRDTDEIEQPSPKPIIDCYRIRSNAVRSLYRSIVERDIQEILYEIDPKRDACGINEFTFRAKNLLSILRSEFSFFLDDETTVSLLLSYKKSIEYQSMISDDPDYHADTLSLMIQKYNQATVSLANELLPQQKPDSAEYLLCMFYANDFQSFFQTIWSSSSNASELHKILWAYRNKIEWEFEFQAKLSAGLWFPLGSNNILGIHPQFGIAWGIKAWIFQLDLSVITRFIDTSESYMVERNSKLYNSNLFFGGYVGADISIDLVKFGIHEIRGVIGIGYDNFEALKQEVHGVDKHIDCFSFHIGIEYRLNIFLGYPKPDFYGGYFYSDNRYTFLNHQNPNGTDLSGDAISTLIGIGSTLHKDKYNKLREIHVY